MADTLDTLIQNADWDDFALLCDMKADRVPAPTPLKRLALFARDLSPGGIARVLSILAGIFVKEGFEVWLFTHETDASRLASLPEGISHVGLPVDRLEQLAVIRESIESLKIDLCIFNDHWSRRTFYLMHYARLLGVRTALIMHTTFFHSFYSGLFDLNAEQVMAFRGADAVCCLTVADTLWWRASGVKTAAYLPNPLTFVPEEVAKSDGKGKTLLFVGRLAKEKGVDFLPLVMREMKELEPEARLVILGDFETNRLRRSFHRTAKRLGVQDKIEVRGMIRDVSAPIAESSVLLITSLYEGHHMARCEAGAHGVPCVTFAMPYLEPVPLEQNGAIVVGKEDARGMAEAAAGLLHDRVLWSRKSREALAALEEFRPERVAERWRRLFASVERGSVEDDFRPERGLDTEFLRMTCDEWVTVAKVTARNFGRYSYLKPVDRVLSFLLPEGSAAREKAASFAQWIRAYFRKRRDARKKRNG